MGEIAVNTNIARLSHKLELARNETAEKIEKDLMQKSYSSLLE
ncbi:MAG: hypothetical protein AB1349_13000 [Elusimicrobiota bacterium]